MAGHKAQKLFLKQRFFGYGAVTQSSNTKSISYMAGFVLVVIARVSAAFSDGQESEFAQRGNLIDRVGAGESCLRALLETEAPIFLTSLWQAKYRGGEAAASNESASF